MNRVHKISLQDFDLSAASADDGQKVPVFTGGARFVTCGNAKESTSNGPLIKGDVSGLVYIRVPGVINEWYPLKSGDAVEVIIPRLGDGKSYTDCFIRYPAQAGKFALISFYDPENSDGR